MKIDQNLIDKAIKAIMDLFGKEVAKPVKPLEAIPSQMIIPGIICKPIQDIEYKQIQDIDWNNPESKISEHFTVKEALWLPGWKRLANEADGLNDTVKTNLIKIFKKMDTVRNFLGKPIKVHCAYRPEEYNKSVKGAAHSSHKADVDSAAVDWDCGENCFETQKKLDPMLEGWELRMENNGSDATWVHLDNREVPPGGKRWFKP